jgi:hypothetical protein
MNWQFDDYFFFFNLKKLRTMIIYQKLDLWKKIQYTHDYEP